MSEFPKYSTHLIVWVMLADEFADNGLERKDLWGDGEINRISYSVTKNVRKISNFLKYQKY